SVGNLANTLILEHHLHLGALVDDAGYQYSLCSVEVHTHCRVGEITDIFCVPTSELKPEQVARKGLLASELDWESAVEPSLPTVTQEDRDRYASVLAELQALTAEMRECQRARQDIAGWKRNIHVKTTGGELTITIDDGDLAVKEGLVGTPDFVMVCADPRTPLEGLAYRGSLTQAIMDRELWISKNPEFTTIFKLERMARSLARTKKV
ncbi:MAG: SCP2 sterol-binding domain-containing protein, partial [Chloroflexi bacterium]|nr:SCP2 sterol-binding domain-containing protein [Chloroflexota bacterium]